MLALKRRGRRCSLRLLGWSSLRLLAILLNASGLVRHFSYRSKITIRDGGTEHGGTGHAPGLPQPVSRISGRKLQKSSRM